MVAHFLFWLLTWVFVGVVACAVYDGLKHLAKCACATPVLVRLALALAVGLLPRRDRERYAEEWLAELDGRTGLKAFGVVCGFIWSAAGRRVRAPLRHRILILDQPGTLNLIRGVTAVRTTSMRQRSIAASDRRLAIENWIGDVGDPATTAWVLLPAFQTVRRAGRLTSTATLNALAGNQAAMAHVTADQTATIEVAIRLAAEDGKVLLAARPHRLNWRLTVEPTMASFSIDTGLDVRCTTLYAIARWRPWLRRRVRDLGLLYDEPR